MFVLSVMNGLPWVIVFGVPIAIGAGVLIKKGFKNVPKRSKNTHRLSDVIDTHDELINSLTRIEAQGARRKEQMAGQESPLVKKEPVFTGSSDVVLSSPKPRCGMDSLASFVDRYIGTPKLNVYLKTKLSEFGVLAESSQEWSLALVSLYDELLQAQSNNMTSEADELMAFCKEIERILKAAGCRLVREQLWNPEVQQAVVVIPNEDAESIQITDIISSGLIWHNQLVRKEKVSVIAPQETI